MRPLLFFCAVTSLASAEYRPQADAGPHEVRVETGEWIDNARDGRDVPWKLYLPAAGDTALPVVVFSHGLGGTRNGAEYMGRHLASHGYAAFHIQHHGSDSAVWKDGVQGALRNATRNPRAALDRFRDVQFTVDQIEAMTVAGPFAGRFDTKRMGMSGHSYGAITTLVAAGQSGGALGHPLAEPRFKAALGVRPTGKG